LSDYLVLACFIFILLVVTIRLEGETGCLEFILLVFSVREKIYSVRKPRLRVARYGGRRKLLSNGVYIGDLVCRTADSRPYFISCHGDFLPLE